VFVSVEPEWLAERLEAGASYEAIARECGCSPSKVSYWAGKYGLTSAQAQRHAGRGGIERAMLEQMIEDGLTVRAIAERLDSSAARIRYWITRHELATTAAVWRATRLAAARDDVRLCATHGLVPHVARASGFRCRTCAVEQVTARRRRVKRILVEEAGGRCVVCGYDRCPRALEFHHLDPTDKRFPLAHRGLSQGIAKLRAEAAKCVLLCSNCHAEVEDGLVDVQGSIETARRSMLRDARPDRG
jgi:transposase-like protein